MGNYKVAKGVLCLILGEKDNKISFISRKKLFKTLRSSCNVHFLRLSYSLS